MTLRNLGLLLTALLLAGCSGSSGGSTAQDGPSAEAGGGGQRLTAKDGSLSVEVPSDWSALEQAAQPPVLLVAQGEDRVDQLIVRGFAEAGQAEQEAVFTTTGLAGQGITCTRVEDATGFGSAQLVFDCPQEDEGGTVRRLFFPVQDEQRSALVLLQTRGETLAEAARVAGPVLQSLRWR